MKKRLVALVMVLSLVFGLCSFTVWADEEEESTQQAEETAVTASEETVVTVSEETDEEDMVTVTFIDEESGQEISYSYAAGTEITLPECLFEIPEYYDIFIGWYDGGNAGGLIRSAGVTYTVTEDISFWAMFGYDDEDTDDPDDDETEEEEYPAAAAGNTYTVYVEAGGETYYSFTPDESGYYVFYTVSDDYDTYMYLYDSDFELLRSNDDGGSGLNAKIKYYFEAGETYYVGLAFFSSDTEGSYDFVCERYYPAVSAQLILTTDYVEIIEGIDSYTDEDENGEDYEYYYLESDNFSYGDQIIVTFEDNTTETYTFDGSDFYNEAGEDIGGWYDDTNYYDQYYSHWTVGGTYSMSMCLEDLDDVSVTVPVKIIENPYASAVISAGATLTQGLDSAIYYDEEGNYYDYYYVYNIEFSEGDTITITAKDGTVIEYVYTIYTYSYEYEDGSSYSYSYGVFEDEYGNGLDYSYYYDSYDQGQEDEHWEAGGTYIVSMYLYDYGLYVYVSVTIEENPYSGAAVTLDFAEDIVLSECTDAYEAYDENDEVYNRYSFWSIDFTEGDQIIITFEDGTTETYTYSVYYSWTYTDDDGEEITEYDYWFVDEDGNYMSYDITSNQYYDHWYAGNTYYFILTIYDYGLSVEIPVTVSDHDWELTQVITAATCTEEGSGIYTCADCGETKTDVIAAAGHSYEVTEYVAATETTDGYIVYTCSVCGDTYTEILAATGSTDTTSPQTGDENSLMLWIMLAALAAAGAGIGFARKKFE